MKVRMPLWGFFAALTLVGMLASAAEAAPIATRPSHCHSQFDPYHYLQ